MPHSIEELAYAAGIIDGEGCIRTNSQRSQYAVVRVHVTNTNKLLTSWLLRHFGGYVWEEKGNYVPNAKPRFIWEVSAKKALVFLEYVRPYLMLKREQAEIAIDIQRSKHSTNHIPTGTVLWRADQVARLSILNRKGVMV